MGQGLVVGFECLLTREDGIIDVFPGTLRGWDYGNGPDNVDSDHVFLGYDFASKFSELTREEKPESKKLKTENFYVGESSSREEKPESQRLKGENFYAGESSSSRWNLTLLITLSKPYITLTLQAPLFWGQGRLLRAPLFRAAGQCALRALCNGHRELRAPLFRAMGQYFLLALCNGCEGLNDSLFWCTGWSSPHALCSAHAQLCALLFGRTGNCSLPPHPRPLTSERDPRMSHRREIIYQD
ncbi:hypothetical protein Patl1_07722 [Pistacia atlantica]|uniref:Uncharacterized protein n=1 Tax=Pistacia atlantica TaxID=434234 RepID=A0ACC1AFY1_9ROSI|nr:hypothetical protein Patl1_07722 [Pistacia atlantica]